MNSFTPVFPNIVTLESIYNACIWLFCNVTVKYGAWRKYEAFNSNSYWLREQLRDMPVWGMVGKARIWGECGGLDIGGGPDIDRWLG